MADTYVETTLCGDISCLDYTVLARDEIENSKAVEQARVYYVERMKLQITYPTETQDILSNTNAACLSEALSLFMKHSSKDVDQIYQKRLMEFIQVEYSQICERNCQESQKVCEQKLHEIFDTMEDKLSSGYYTTSGGYNKYCNDFQKMTSQYRSAKGKGVKAEEVLKEYLDDKENIAKTILAADKSLTEAEQKAAEEKAKRQRLEHQKQIMEENMREQQRLEDDKQKAHVENVRQMKEKMEKERKEAMAEIKAKEKEMQELRRQSRETKAKKQNEIDKLKEKMANMEEEMEKTSQSGCTIL